MLTSVMIAVLVSSMVALDYTAEQREILNPYSKKGLLPEQGAMCAAYLHHIAMY